MVEFACALDRVTFPKVGRCSEIRFCANDVDLIRATEEKRFALLLLFSLLLARRRCCLIDYDASFGLAPFRCFL